MTLFEYLQLCNDEEITVFDKDYDMETYFYKNDYSEDRWSNAMIDLSKKLEVVSVSDGAVIANLSNVIEAKMKMLKKADLFRHCNIEAIMDDMMNILAGNVSEDWLVKFVSCL